MSNVGDLVNRETKAPHVKFERRPIEDAAESLKQGRYVAKDVDHVIVTSPYSKDNVIHKVDQWFKNVKQQVENNRTPQAWLDQWRAMYEAWKNGQELPLKGTPIRGWGVISPAQQENLIRFHVLTVEDLAATNEEGLRRFGMGALDMKNKAKAWLAQLNDSGAVVQEMAAIKAENERLKHDNETLMTRVNLLADQVGRLSSMQLSQISSGDVGPIVDVSIGASDILEDEPVQEVKRRGRPPKQVENEVI